MLHGHGGDVYSIARELGIRPDQVLDFSSNCSPLPYPKGLKEYLCQSLDQMHLLPEVDSMTIRTLLAKRYALNPENFLLGSGTTQWIYSLPRILKPERALIAYPTYADYEDACKAEGVPVISIGTFPGGGEADVRGLVGSISSIEDRLLDRALIFICNPNNPTGLFIPPEELAEIINSKPASATWVIDEAYAPFVDEDARSSLLGCGLPENVVLLRSFSKIYGIPGLRVGCLVTRAKVMEQLMGIMRPWAVNRMAQLAVEFLLKEPAIEEQARNYCQKEKDFIVEGLSKLEGLFQVEGRCHYVLFSLKGLSAQNITNCLKKRGILIRDCHNFKGLDGQFIRISPRLHKDNQRLMSEMTSLCS